MGKLFKKVRSARQSLRGDADRRTRLGNVLALLFITAGFVLIGLAWNGAASQNFIQRQFPYLISGGVMGLGLIVTGMLLALMSALRAERRALARQYDEVITLLGRNLARMGAGGGGVAGGEVVAAGSSYHRPGCRVLEGKPGAVAVSLEQAAAEGLTRCRVCDPPAPASPPPSDAGVPAASEGDRAQVDVTASEATDMRSEAAEPSAAGSEAAEPSEADDAASASEAAAPERAGEADPGAATEALLPADPSEASETPAR
ncbi:MAG TPA: hypothetical protein VHJ34_08340 [Actinomycetota bacterium]|nr:hypothetical protein [Actinomycetota bacterium]